MGQPAGSRMAVGRFRDKASFGVTTISAPAEIRLVDSGLTELAGIVRHKT